jgi:hypothetical protein
VNWVDINEAAPLPVVVSDGFSFDDVVQGNVGDCYFISQLANMIEVPALLDSVLVTAEVNDEGVFCVRLFVNGAWRHLFLDARMPAMKGVWCEAERDPATGGLTMYRGAPDAAGGRFPAPAGAHSATLSEMWPRLLEKAWARLHGSYPAIDGDAIAPGEGFPVSFFSDSALGGGQLSFADVGAETSWSTLCGAKARGWTVMLGSAKGQRGFLWRTRAVDADGIVGEHAYSLLRTLALRGSDGNELRLLMLRNPHARGEWKGAFSDFDAAAWTPALRAATGHSPEHSGDDGTFWMALPDVLRKFDGATITPLLHLAADGDGGTWHRHVTNLCPRQHQ